MTSVKSKFTYNGDDMLFKKPVEKYDHSTAVSAASAPCNILDGQLINFDAQKKEFELNMTYPPVCSEMIESDKWVKKYGLKANRLTFENILSMIGFKKQQDYMDQVKRIVSSKYSKGLFLQTQSKDGLIYNITVNVNKLIEFSHRLEDSIKMFKLRLKWLNTDSRRIFGVITEQSVCLVVDCKTKDSVKFSQYRNCLIKLLKEQISKISSFNIVRCADKIEFFREKAVVVSAQSIEDCIEWLNEWNRDYVKVTPDTVTCESVMLAYKDNTIEALYLISQGISSNGVREILYDKSVKLTNDTQTRLNVVSFDCIDHGTVEYLRRLALNTRGRFHAYCLLKQYDDYEPGPIDPDPTKSKVIMNKRVFGGAPPGSGVKNDLMLVFEEIQSAMETLENLQSLIESMNRVQNLKNPLPIQPSTNDKKNLKNRDEEYLTSREWLQKHGLTTKSLDLFDVLSKVCFRHCDGVIDVKKEPITGKCFFVGGGIRYYQGDAIPATKLVNAKYCDQFAHVLWNDGTVMHVHVTPDLHREYERKINIYLQLYEKRIDWLSKGSRELFGTVIENNICILIDTSQSMQLSLDFVKRKLEVLIQEQLKSKQRFNLISFNNKIYPWRDRMVEVDEFNIKSALDWIKGLNAQGTTNTLAAIRFALSDLNTEAIYLLSDGRPDQEPRQILSQVHLNTRIPIHTISFNCNDSEANKFLSKLAEETSARYHYFNESGWDSDPDGPIPYQSEDISMLKKEIEKGQLYLLQMATLREECAKLSVSNKIYENKKLLKRNIDTLESESSVFQSKYRSKTSFEKSKIGFDMNNGVLNSLHDINTLEWVLPETRTLLERQFRKQMAVPKQQEKPVPKKTTKNVQKKSRPKTTELAVLNNHSKLSKWMESNNLRVLKLTIFDALLKSEGTSDNNLIVDELFSAKIWTEIMEHAEKSKIDTSKFKLVNPSKVNWSKYLNDLNERISSYKRFLVEAIWTRLPDHEKILLNLTPPIDYDSNKIELLKSLDYSHWPVKKQDIELFEDEINKAETYKRFANELEYYFDSKSKIENYKDDFDDHVEGKPKLSDVNISLKSFVTKKKSQTFSVGDKVIAGNSKLGYYYDGKIIKSIDSAHYNIKFDFGSVQNNVLNSNIIKKNDTAPYLSIGDFVMARVINDFDQSCWVPGVIHNIDTLSLPKVFTVLFFNGEEGKNVRNDLIKIDKTVYGFAVNFIKSLFSDNVTRNISVDDVSSGTEITKEPSFVSSRPDADRRSLTDIVEQIKNHIDSLHLDDKYKKMYDQFSKLKKKHKSMEKNLDGRYNDLRLDFDEFKNTIPEMISNLTTEIHISKSSRPKSSLSPKPVKKRENKKPKPSNTLLDLRHKLPEIRPNTEVLAKWSDDFWYYKSMIKEAVDDYKYKVYDFLNDWEEVYRENIIAQDDYQEQIQVGDFVIAEHQDYVSSYAPGQVTTVLSNGYFVKFYDFSEFMVLAHNVYKIPEFKYEIDVNEIINKEREWVGKQVVVRNPVSRLYEHGKVLSRTENGRRFTIRLANKKDIIVDIIHMFGELTRKRKIGLNDFVLAPREGHYLPGQVIEINDNQLTVKFIDKKRDNQIDYDECYWISREYFIDSQKFHSSKEDFDFEVDRPRSNQSRRSSIPIVNAKQLDESSTNESADGFVYEK